MPAASTEERDPECQPDEGRMEAQVTSKRRPRAPHSEGPSASERREREEAGVRSLNSRQRVITEHDVSKNKSNWTIPSDSGTGGGGRATGIGFQV